MSFAEKFEASADRLPTTSERERALIGQYFSLLIEWNERMNLVSRKSIDKVFAYHYADSLWICDLAEKWRESRPVMDLGTGAGFPGVLFAIRFPGVPITLFEKSPKKRLFLKAVLERLALTHAKLEGELVLPKAPAFLLARAVHPPPELLKLYATLPGGSRGVLNLGSAAEPPAIPKSLKLLEGPTRYTLPEDAGDRQLFVFETCST